jgi:hypothetical protein
MAALKTRGPMNLDRRTAEGGCPYIGFAGVGGRWRPPLHLISCRHAAVFFQPLQFLTDFDLAVPGILVQAVAFAGEN